MIEINEIRDGRSLEKWLIELRLVKGLGKDDARKISIAISHRMAMRNLPLWWEEKLEEVATKNGRTLLPVLRSNLIAGVAVVKSDPKLRNLAGAASQAVDINSAGFLTVAARAVTDTIYDSRSKVFSEISFATMGTDISQVQVDCRALAEGKDILSMPLWETRPNPLEETWSSVKSFANDPKWAFWIKWYDDALAGIRPNWDMLEQIALIKPEVWEEGAEAVAAKIAEIEIDHALAATPNAEDIRINDAGNYQAFPRSTLPARTLEDANHRIGDVIRLIRGAQTNNQYTALAPEADLLEDFQARYGDNALRLIEVCNKVVRHIGHHLADGVLPENDNLVGDVSGDLQNTADDIYNFDDEAKKAIDARAKLRFERLSDEELERVVALTESVAKHSEDHLAQELREDATVVKQEDEPTEDTSAERYRLGSRLLRIVALGGKLLKDVTDAILLLDGLRSGIAAFWWIIRALLGL